MFDVQVYGEHVCPCKGRLRVYFRSKNAVFSKIRTRASEEVVIGLLGYKCLPIQLCGIESHPLILPTDKHPFEFYVTKVFMKLFKTNSSLIERKCQNAFRFIPITKEIDIRTASFLQRYTITENITCVMFLTNAAE
jgi:hypothetical protein